VKVSSPEVYGSVYEKRVNNIYKLISFLNLYVLITCEPVHTIETVFNLNYHSKVLYKNMGKQREAVTDRVIFFP